MRKTLERFSINNKGFVIVIVLQLILITGLLLLAIVRPQENVTILSSDFRTDDYSENIFESDDFIQFRCDEQLQEIIRVRTSERTISSGCYDVNITYTSYVEEPPNIENSTATITFLPSKFVKAQEIVLDDVHPTAKGRIWIPLGGELEDFQLEIGYNGSGMLTIYHIQLQEQLVYRYVRAAGVLLLMALCDFLYYIFFARDVHKRNYIKEGMMLIGIAAIASILFFNDYLILGHDMDFHLTRIAAIAEEFSNGQFPVRMMTTMCNGYGYANSLFYCDLFLWIPAILYNLMIPLQVCYKIYVVLINLLTAVIAYECFREISKSRKNGMIGSALYTLSTYRLTNLCLRAAVGEYTAMTFFPLIILGMYKIYTSKKVTWKEWIPLALGMSGVVMSHILSVIMLTFALIIFCVAALKKTLSDKRWFAIIKAALLTILLTSWFVVPFVESYLCMNLQVSNDKIEYIQRRGTYLLQLFSVFAPAFGGNVNDGMRNEMPLTIGFALTIGMVGVFYYFWKRSEWKIEEEKSYQFVRAFTLLAILMLAFTLHMFPWNILQRGFGKNVGMLLGMVQYPWRYLALATVLIIPAVILALKEFEKRSSKIYYVFLKGMGIALISSVGFFYFQLAHNATEARYYDMTNNHMLGVMVGEYFLDEIEEEVIDTGMINTVSQTIVSGNAVVENYEQKDGIVKFLCKNLNDGETVIEVPIIAYDHYRAFDSETKIELMLEKSDKGLLEVKIPNSYVGNVKIVYDPPFYWHIAELVSLGTIVGLLFFVVKERKKEDSNDRTIKI